MKANYLKNIFLVALLISVLSCGKDDDPGKEKEETVPETGYMHLKHLAKNDPSDYYQDFSADQAIEKIASDQWKIGSTVWWVVPWNATPEPVFQDSCMVLTSVKSAASGVNEKNEVQTIDEFQIGNSGELIIGYKSSRWAKGYSEDDHWVDSSVGMELYGDVHRAIVFTYGSMGAFADPTGSCPDNSCMYAKASNWPAISTENEFLGVRITWQTAGDNTKTFKLYFNDDPIERAELTQVPYDLGSLRVRFNANVTDADMLPAEDSDTLLIDYVCIKAHIMDIQSAE